MLQLKEFASFFLVNKRAPVVFGSEGYTLVALLVTVTTRMITFFNSRSLFFNWYWVGSRSKDIHFYGYMDCETAHCSNPVLNQKLCSAFVFFSLVHTF